jgi:arginyl-tRNA synthetase
MASRKGNVITARELIADLTERALVRNPDPVIAHQVAIGALKYLILRSAPGGSIVFDPEQSLSLEGDSGPYLQYALVRARTILAKSTVVASEPLFAEVPVLARLIIRFPEVVKKAQQLEGPHVLVQYLTQLAATWNAYYAHERIIGERDEAEKIALVQAFVSTMEAGFQLLAIPVPETM